MKNIKIVAIDPPKIEGKYFCVRMDKVSIFYDNADEWNPIQLASIIAALKHNLRNAEVIGIDAQFDGLSIEGVKKELGRLKPDLVICLISAFAIPHDRKIAEMHTPTIGVITPSGVNVSEAIRMYDLKTEFFTKREIEYTLINAVKEFQKNGKISDTKGMIINKNGKIKDTGDPIFIPFDELPMPAYDSLPSVEEHMRKTKMAVLYTSKGCNFNCSFCCVHDIPKSYRSMKQVIDEIKFLKKNYGIEHISFHDNEFALDMARAKKLCSAMIKEKLNIRWRAMNRVELVDDELLSLMSRAGCYQINYGIESGDEKVRELANKKFTNKQAIDASIKTLEHNMLVGASFIIGLPGENRETMHKTIDLFKRMKATNYSVNILYPSPGGKMYCDLKKEGRLKINDWSKYKLLSDKRKEMIFIHDFYKNMDELVSAKNELEAELQKYHIEHRKEFMLKSILNSLLLRKKGFSTSHAVVGLLGSYPIVLNFYKQHPYLKKFKNRFLIRSF